MTEQRTNQPKMRICCLTAPAKARLESARAAADMAAQTATPNEDLPSLAAIYEYGNLPAPGQNEGTRRGRKPDGRNHRPDPDPDHETGPKKTPSFPARGTIPPLERIRWEEKLEPDTVQVHHQFHGDKLIIAGEAARNWYNKRPNGQRAEPMNNHVIKNDKIGDADPKALAIAQWLHQATNAESTYLFGSRARGDYNKYSDIDVLVITPYLHNEAWLEKIEDRARQLQYEQDEQVVSVQVVNMTPQEFHRRRKLLNNLAHSVATEGLPVMASERLNYGGSYPEDEHHDAELEYPQEASLDWEDVANRLKDGLDYADDLDTFQDTGALERLKDKTLGNTAQQALENTYRALLAASGVDYPKGGRDGHNLRILTRLIKTETEWPEDKPVPGEEHNYLTAFAGSQRYAHEHMPLDKANLVKGVTEAVREIHGLIQEVWNRHNQMQ